MTGTGWVRKRSPTPGRTTTMLDSAAGPWTRARVRRYYRMGSLWMGKRRCAFLFGIRNHRREVPRRQVLDHSLHRPLRASMKTHALLLRLLLEPCWLSGTTSRLATTSLHFPILASSLNARHLLSGRCTCWDYIQTSIRLSGRTTAQKWDTLEAREGKDSSPSVK